MIEPTQELIQLFETKAKEHFAHRRAEAKDVPQLIDSMEYSFFNGGKRFRPLLCYAVGQALGLKPEAVTSFAIALESIHTYSLIHDDLPCMDDDNERRGQPTNHIQYSEDIALLAGDALLTESFLIVAQSYPALSSKLISALSDGAGLNGMIRGQILDLGKGDPINSLAELINLHELKTGRLIALCFLGPAIIANRESRDFFDLGLSLGLAFQIKDDLLDAEEEDQASFVNFLGVEGTEQQLQSLTEKISSQLKSLELDSPMLIDLIQFNFSRTK